MNDHSRWSDEKLQMFYLEFKQHADDESASMSRFLSAFPNEDTLGHRMYHEAQIRASEAQEKFWQELRLDIAKKSIWGLFVILIGLAIAGAIGKLKGLAP